MDPEKFFFRNRKFFYNGDPNWIRKKIFRNRKKIKNFFFIMGSKLDPENFLPVLYIFIMKKKFLIFFCLFLHLEKKFFFSGGQIRKFFFSGGQIRKIFSEVQKKKYKFFFIMEIQLGSGKKIF